MSNGQYKGHEADSRAIQVRDKDANQEDFVLEKSIFSNIFEKDIRRVFIYKKAERLAKAIHLIAPAFVHSPSLRDKVDAIAIGLVNAAIEPPGAARAALSRELLALSSVLSIARTGGHLSSMNAEVVGKEARQLLQEIAAYEEPRLFFDEAPTLAEIARRAGKPVHKERVVRGQNKTSRSPGNLDKGHIKDIYAPPEIRIKDRQDNILSVIKDKGGRASIKDISTVVLGVSEKTIQRELQALIESGDVIKEGERRWSTYSLAHPA